MSAEILIVDDSLPVRADLQRALIGAGYCVTACKSVGEARAQLWRKRFALLILDVMLPDGDGLDLLRDLKADPERAGIPVLLLSTEAEVGSRVRGLALGADDYVGKPYEPSYVLRRVRQLLGDEKAGTGAQPGVRERRVLVIGDRSTYLAVLAQRLRLDRHDVVLAHSVKEALELLSIAQVDCIVVDTKASGIDAVEIARRLKRHYGNAAIPVLALVGSDDDLAREQALAAEVDGITLRSTDLQFVRARVRELLRKGQSGPPTSRPKIRPLPPSTKRSEPTPSLFAKVVAASGLALPVGRTTLERACLSAGAKVENMGPTDLMRALPAIEQALRAYMSPSEATERVKAMIALLRLSNRRRP
jgi:DNA-binding response OmpR family regulator